MKQLICSRMARAAGTLAAIALLTAAPLAAQTGSITGRVTDAQSGQPVPAAQVFIQDLNLGVLTRQNGSYLLLNVPPGTHTVTVQRIGFQEATADVTMTAGGSQTLDFRVSQQALQLDEVVVTGTVGQQQRRAVANSVAAVDASQVASSVALTSMQELLSARAPGLEFSRTSGNVGSGSPIAIRGFSSITLGNQPLIYVDGVRVDNSYGQGPDSYAMTLGALARDGGGQGSSALDDINPNDIESVEIIKGPAAATLYGAEASAGVIQIITKKGVQGAPEFTVTVRQGSNFMLDPAGIIGDQWGCAANGTATSNFSQGYSLPCLGDDPATTAVESGDDRLIGPFNIYDYHKDQGRNLVNNGYTSGYNLGIRGGTDQVRYFVSGDWIDDTGIVSYNTNDRLSLRSNIDVLFTDNFTVSLNAGFSDGSTSYAQQHQSQGGFWNELIFAQGDQLIDHPKNVAVGGQANDPQFSNGNLYGADGFYERDPDTYRQVESIRDFQRMTTSLVGQLTIGDWLTQRLTVGFDRDWGENTYLVPRSGIRDDYPFPNTSDGTISLTEQFANRLSVDYNVSAEYQLNDALGFTTSVGGSYNSSDRTTSRNSADILPAPIFRTIGNAQDHDPTRYTVSQSRSIRFFVQEAVAINDRLYLTAALSGNDNSGFGIDTEILVYPNLQASWVVSEEPFWNIGLFDELRLRTAWGAAGRPPGTFSRANQFEEAVGPGGTSAITFGSPGNSSVEPESSSEIELGADFAMFNQRVSGEFTYFHQWVRDAIVSQTLAPSNGFAGDIQTNLGEMNNWGWEASLNFRVMQTPAFAFDLTLSGDHTDNKIISLTEEQQDDNFVEGYYYPNVAFIHLDSVARYDCGGPCNVNTDPNLDQYSVVSPYGGGNEAWLPFCDLGDPSAPRKEATSPDAGLFPGGASVPCAEAITGNQELFAGRAFSPYNWTVAPTFRFLNSALELRILAQGQYGRWLADLDVGDRSSLSSSAAAGGFYRRNARLAFAQDDPYYLAAKEVGDERWSGRYDASFWKLREIGLRYQLPRSIVEGVGIDRASISVSGRNLWTIWKRTDEDRAGVHIPDPENVNPFSGEPNFSLQQLPGISSFSATLRVAF